MIHIRTARRPVDDSSQSVEHHHNALHEATLFKSIDSFVGLLRVPVVALEGLLGRVQLFHVFRKLWQRAEVRLVGHPEVAAT